MLLTEPGSRIDGPTEDVLRTLFYAAWRLLGEDMPEDRADSLSLRLLVRVHDALAQEGFVVRQYPGADNPADNPAGAGGPARCTCPRCTME